MNKYLYNKYFNEIEFNVNVKNNLIKSVVAKFNLYESSN